MGVLVLVYFRKTTRWSVGITVLSRRQRGGSVGSVSSGQRGGSVGITFISGRRQGGSIVSLSSGRGGSVVSSVLIVFFFFVGGVNWEMHL